jgi:cytochrome c oxidase subunit 2
MPAVAALLLAAPVAHAAWTLNMTPGISEMSREIYSLHMLMFWWCVGIAIVVFGFMIYSMVHFRKSKGAVADQHFLHSNRIEIIWTLVPVLILISMAVPAARVLVQTEDPVATDLTIRVTGYQWKWAYEYADTGVTILSTLARDSNRARQLGSGVDPFSVPNYLLEVDHPLVVPAGVKVRVLITANDVIHSWWVPALAIKKDAIPGFINEAWFDIDADKTRHLPWPVRRAVRPRPRLHADRARGQEQSRISTAGSRTRRPHSSCQPPAPRPIPRRRPHPHPHPLPAARRPRSPAPVEPHCRPLVSKYPEPER